MITLIMIVQEAQRAAADMLGAAMDYGAGTFSIPLSTDGAEPATHYAASLVRRADAMAEPSAFFASAI